MNASELYLKDTILLYTILAIFIFMLGVMFGRIYQTILHLGLIVRAQEAKIAWQQARYSQTLRYRLRKSIRKILTRIGKEVERGFVAAGSIRPIGTPRIGDYAPAPETPTTESDAATSRS